MLAAFLFAVPAVGLADTHNVSEEISPTMLSAVSAFRSCIADGNLQEANRAGTICGAYFGSKLQSEKLQQCLRQENISYVGAIKRRDGTVFETLLTFRCGQDSELSLSLRKSNEKYAITALHDLLP